MKRQHVFLGVGGAEVERRRRNPTRARVNAAVTLVILRVNVGQLELGREQLERTGPEAHEDVRPIRLGATLPDRALAARVRGHARNRVQITHEIRDPGIDVGPD